MNGRLPDFERLPCGGSITRGAGDELNRIVRHIGPGDREVVFVLAHPPRLADGAEDTQMNLCLAFGRMHTFDVVTILYLLPYPASDAKDLEKRSCPRGPGPNNLRIQDMAVRYVANSRTGIVIAAWGEAGRIDNADASFIRRYDGSPGCFSWARSTPLPIYCLGFTASGAPVSLTPANLDSELVPLYDLTPPQPRKAAA